MYTISIRTIYLINHYSIIDYESLKQIFLEKYRYGDGGFGKCIIASIV